MLVGLGTAVYTGYRGYQATSESGKYASLSGNAGGQDSAAVRDLLQSLRDERGLTGEVLGDPTTSTKALQDQWAKTDRAATAVRASARPIVSQAAIEGLVALRPKIVARQVPLMDAVDAYSTVIVDAESRRSTSLSEVVPDPRVVRQDEINTKLSDLTETLEVSDALSFSAFSDAGMPSDVMEAYSRATGDLQSLLTSLQRALPPDEAGELNRLTTGPDGEVVAVVQRAVLHGSVLRNAAADTRGGNRQDTGGTQGDGTGKADRGHRDPAGQGTAAAPLRVEDASVHVDLPVPRADWRSSTSQMSSGLVALQSRHLTYAAGIARDVGKQQLTTALLGSIALFVFAIVVLAISLGVSRTLIGRLRSLRQETIELSHSRLPALVARLREGEQVDIHRELPPLDFGGDEIGQVAAAFGEAQRTAVAAAAQEAETRSGLRKVFLDIAHRSQAIVYRQLKVLDQAERGQEDPDQLELLFQLDHLATRARRHAENLIILGGGQAGRQWRDPVVLLQLIRSAISEAENYTRVSVTGVPDVTVLGAAVADLIHLLAELVDNATSFSPPASIVEVRGNLVGRGLVIEIEDQGLGVDPSQLEQFNEMLHNPPDFQMMALAEEPRLGLFVVARLAARHGIRVTLTASPAYGGTKVVVLIPATLFVAGHAVDAPQPITAGRADASTRALQALPTEPSQPTQPSRPELVRPEPRLEPVRSEPSWPEPPQPEPPRPEPLRPVAVPTPAPLTLAGPRDQVPPGPRQPAQPVAPLPSRSSSRSATRSTPPARTLPGDDSPLFHEVERATYETAERPAHLHGQPPAVTQAPPPPPPSPAPTAGPGGRPDLPRRVRQSHMSPKLLQDHAVTSDAGTRAPAPVDAETARSRMSALQRGTMRGRATEPGEPR